MAFADRIRFHVVLNGVIEVGLGVALLNRGTRRTAHAAAQIYFLYFLGSIARHQLRLRADRGRV